MSTPPLSDEHARTPTIDIANVDFVPEELPPSADTPLKARPVNFFAALFGYWLFADRWGPYLAAGSHLRALTAYLIHFLVISACGLATFLLRSSGDIHSITDLRQAVANLILMLMTEFRLNVAQQVGIVLAPLSLLLILLALSFLTAPWAAQGDTFRSAWSRTFRSMLWSMSVFSLTAVLLMVGYWMTATVFNGDVRIHKSSDPFNGASVGINEDYTPETIGFLLGCLAFARAAWAGMRRYVGPAVGPGFEPRHPLCHTCSYPIVGLPMTGICPECQTPVQNSLPEQPLYTHDELKQALSVSRPMKYLRFSRHLVGQPEILKLLPVRNAQLGVRYWQVTYALSALLGLALAAALAIAPFTTEPTIALGMFGVVLFGMPILQFLYVLIGAAFGWGSYRIRDLRLVVGVAGYASGHWWPYYLGMFFLIAVLSIPPLADCAFGINGGVIDVRGMAIMAMVLATVIFLPAMVVRLRSGLQIARHSNIN